MSLHVRPRRVSRCPSVRNFTKPRSPWPATSTQRAPPLEKARARRRVVGARAGTFEHSKQCKHETLQTANTALREPECSAQVMRWKISRFALATHEDYRFGAKLCVVSHRRGVWSSGRWAAHSTIVRLTRHTGGRMHGSAPDPMVEATDAMARRMILYSSSVIPRRYTQAAHVGDTQVCHARGQVQCLLPSPKSSCAKVL